MRTKGKIVLFFILSSIAIFGLCYGIANMAVCDPGIICHATGWSKAHTGLFIFLEAITAIGLIAIYFYP